MKNRIIILIVIFLVSLGFVNGGNNVKDAEPSVSSFDVVKSNEQDLYTGDLGLNLPLLNVPGRSLDVPLSLTYSSGIRVDDEASWVGLGWNLGVGAITRAINNEADDGLYICNHGNHGKLSIMIKIIIYGAQMEELLIFHMMGE